MKKKLLIFAILLLLLALYSVVSATTLTIENAILGHEYRGYKIFDASFSEDGHAAYTINSDDYWFDAVSEGASVFDTEQIGDSNVYIVSPNDIYGSCDQYIIDWFKRQDLPNTCDLEDKIAVNNKVVWEDVPEGYYIITSSLGSTITILNNTGDLVIFDKNHSPGWEIPENPPSGTKPGSLGELQVGKNVSSEGLWYGRTNTAQVGDTVYFKVNAYTPKYCLQYQIYDYVFTDIITGGFRYNEDIKVFIDGVELTDEECTVEITDFEAFLQVIVTINAYEAFADYPVNGHFEMTYSATVLGFDYVLPERGNEAYMNWSQFDPAIGGPDELYNLIGAEYDPYEPDKPGVEPPVTTTSTYTYGFLLDKVNKDGIHLDGAWFRLYDDEMKELKVVGGHGTYHIVNDPIEEGIITSFNYFYPTVIYGIDIGRTYYLEEIKAPDGYNMLTELFPFSFAYDESYDNTDYCLNKPVTVVNVAGSKLPATGSIGTKIFLATGSLIMLSVAMVFVVKKRKAGQHL